MTALIMVRQTNQHMPKLSSGNIDEDGRFADWLRNARAHRGLTMQVLGELADISHASVSKIESGRANPSRDMVQRLAAALTPDGADERTRASLLRDALYAAGFSAPGDLPPSRETIYDPLFDELDIASADGVVTEDMVEDIRRYVRFRINEERQGNAKRTRPEPPPEPGQE